MAQLGNKGGMKTVHVFKGGRENGRQILICWCVNVNHLDFSCNICWRSINLLWSYLILIDKGVVNNMVHNGRHEKSLGYSTSNMHVIAVAWPCNSGRRAWKLFIYSSGSEKIIGMFKMGHKIVFHHGTFQPISLSSLDNSQSNQIRCWYAILKHQTSCQLTCNEIKW